ADLPDRVDALAGSQAGALGRDQLRLLGVSRGFVRTQLRARRWQRPLPRVYVVFTGPMPFLTRVWAALLYAGEGSAASHETAAFLARLADVPPDVVDVTVPHGHRVAARPGVRIRQSRRLADKVHPARLPPQTRLEETVLDLTDEAATEDPVIDVVLRGCQRRLTSPARLAAAQARRKRLRWRRLVIELVADVRAGVLSALERRYLRDVERAHGLPSGRRNRTEGQPGRRRYRDVRYRRWRLVVELDGQAAHPEESREEDDLRDNELVEREDTRTLRYGWRSVTTLGCRSAAQVARVLRAGGWTGQPRRCGPDCAVNDPEIS
ncbi:MAG TPA: hypothetical protein VLW53_05840, partial [Candidatus Eisenbacteria bacterium]|nr:hypothetical protein [Candidatus Eisenbacteria bacterium]